MVDHIHMDDLKEGKKIDGNKLKMPQEYTETLDKSPYFLNLL